jgi:hypothetical protein
MGARGAGNLGNDTALDWVRALEQSTGLGPVERAISQVLHCIDRPRGPEDTEETP